MANGRIVAIANQKGGVGKTTTAVNLAAALAAARHPTLLVDLDPQGNATTGCGVDKRGLELSSCEVLLGDARLVDAVRKTDVERLDLLPANGDLTAAEVGLMKATLRERRLALALASARESYDYIIVDCPPSLNMLTVNALVAADGVVIPLQTEYYALEGLSALVNTIQKIQQGPNHRLRIDGILRTMHDPRNNLANQVSMQLISHFREQVFNTVIPRNVRVAEAPSHGLPVMLYDNASRGAAAYMALASEYLRRENRRAAATT